MESFCNHRKKKAITSVEKYPVGVKFGLSYKVSVGCTILLLGTHITTLLTLQNRSEAQCKSKVPILTSEIMQVVIWAITLFTLYKIPIKKYLKFPWILRAWWGCTFLLSLGSTILEARSMISNHAPLNFVYLAEIVGLLASTCLFGVSIRGNPDIVLDVPNGTTDPLLNKKDEKHSESKRSSLHGKATLFQLITFSWMNPLFAVGIKKPLDRDDVPDLDTRDSSRFLSHSFDESLKHVKQRDQTTSPSLYKVMFVFIRKKAAINAFYAIISAGTSYVGPYLIDDFVNFLNQKKTRS